MNTVKWHINKFSSKYFRIFILFRYEYDQGNFDIDGVMNTRISLNQASVIDNPAFEEEDEDFDQTPFQIRFFAKDSKAAVSGSIN